MNTSYLPPIFFYSTVSSPLVYLIIPSCTYSYASQRWMRCYSAAHTHPPLAGHRVSARGGCLPVMSNVPVSLPGLSCLSCLSKRSVISLYDPPVTHSLPYSKRYIAYAIVCFHHTNNEWYDW